jgi:hypothetical protein
MPTVPQYPFRSCRWRPLTGWIIVWGVLFILACAGDEGGTPEEPGPDPQRAQVDGLVVLHQNAPGTAGEALGVPPQQWGAAADVATFDRALSAATWQVSGSPPQHGSTDATGRFTITGLLPGMHTLTLRRTLNGNLLTLTLPLPVGAADHTAVVVELAWGEGRILSTYTRHGERIREVHGPRGQRLLTVNDRLGTVSDGNRTLSDSNGDGLLDHCEPVAPARDCIPSQITALTVSGASPVILGQTVWVTAVAQLADHTEMDVTHLVTWQSSDTEVAQVTSWGEVTTLRPGTTHLTASLGAIRSAPWALTVRPRPPLSRIYLDNAGCVSILPVPGIAAITAVPPVLQPDDPTTDRLLWAPTCAQVVQVGGTLQFLAIGVFGEESGGSQEAYYEDITGVVTWELVPATVGEVVAGFFTARQVGSVQLRASLGNVESAATTVQVVAEPTAVELSIYPGYGGGNSDTGVGFAIPPGSANGAASVPCSACPEFVLPVLRGDTVPFFATAYYDTGQWLDVTAAVTWRSSQPAVASLDAAGVLQAQTAGTTVVDATLAALASNRVEVRVVNEATLLSLWIVPEGDERVTQQGGQAFFSAQGFYDLGFTRELTTQATWHSSDPRIGSFATPGVLTAHAAGTIEVWATVGDLASERWSWEVFATSALAYCDPEQVNRGLWSDAFNRVILETDCALYTRPGVVTMRYTVTALQPRFGIFDPCLDLYVYQGDRKVRTIREEGCGEPFLPASAAEFAAEELKYQLLAFWDLHADDGTPVAPGTYTILGRFYLYYDPVVRLEVTVR